jgi:ATP-dependent RNA helicase DHX8/PRP22
MVTLVKQHIDHVLVPIQTKYKDEKSEQYLSSTKQGTRVVMSAGCSVADVLMPDEYKSVMVVSFPGMTQFLTVDIVREEFEWYGDITHIEMFRYNKNKQRNWGKVTFETTNQAENAVAESQEEEIIALPTGNARLQNEHRLRAKLEWCRRPSKGSAFVEFSDIRLVSNILRNHRCLVVGGTNARLARSKKDDNQIYVNGLSKFVNEEVLRHSFVNNFGLNDDHIVRASVVRERVQTSGSEIETIRRRLSAHLERYVTDGRFNLQLKPPKDKDFTFVAFASFSIIEEGRNACLNLVENFRPNGEIINSSVSLQASLLVIRTVFEQINSDILKSIARLNKNEGINIRHRILRNGNCAIDMNCDHIDTLHRVRRKLDKLIQGKKMTKQDFPNIHELFTRSGKYELRNIGSRTSTLIIDDYRILEISIFGDRRNQNEAFTLLQEYLHKLTQGVTRTLALKGPDKPYGVIKKMFILYDIDLGKMKRNIRGLHCLQVDLRNHTVSINGLAESVDESILEINNVIDDLRNTQNCDHVENEEHQCSICFMEIDDGEIYRLEACGHPFCKTCIVPQLESAVGNNDFPITCCKEDCGELWSWRDLNSVSLQSGMSINSLVNRATNSYVAKHDKEYKYCISPDCPSIYRVTLRSDVFCCCECEARICTACHSQYHDGLSCDMVKELKEDPSGIQIWLKKDPNNRKPCPNCSLPIEKAGGCNHIECTKCRHHICWVCLEHFKICRNCYIHLEEVHGGYGGDY